MMKNKLIHRSLAVLIIILSINLLFSTAGTASVLGSASQQPKTSHQEAPSNSINKIEYMSILDEHDRPFDWYYNHTGGNRGQVNEAGSTINYVWDGDSVYTATVIDYSGSWTYAGMFYSIIRNEADGVCLDFSEIFGPYVRSEYQGEVTGIEILVSNISSPSNNTDLSLKLELKDEQGVLKYSKTWESLLEGPYPRTFMADFDPSEIGNVQLVAWLIDNTRQGDSISIDNIRLRTNVPDLPTAEKAFLWTYSWLMANYHPESGIVQDRSNFFFGDFENISATSKTAKIVCYAYQKGYTGYEVAKEIVTRIAGTLLDPEVIPQGPDGINSLWPHFTFMDDQTGERKIADNTEWASGDTAYAALDLLAALQIIEDPEGQIDDVIDFLNAIDWEALLLEDNSISHGYSDDGTLLTSFWKGFGMETAGVNWAYAATTGNIVQMNPPPSDTGAGFNDEAQYPMVLSGLDRWGNDWNSYRSQMADAQIEWFCESEHYNQYLCDIGWFGLSAAESPEGDSYHQYGVGGIYDPETGGDEVVVLHYSGMISGLRPTETSNMWENLLDEEVISPLNNIESIRVNKDTGKYTINRLKSSWNLALQAEGWALKDQTMRDFLQTAVEENAFLMKGYSLLKGLNYIEITPDDQIITPGSVQQFTATGSYADSSMADITTSVTWTSSNSTVATIDAVGLVTGHTGGKTVITAMLGDVIGTSILTVTSNSTKYLAAVMDRFHNTYDVYTDAHAAGNHFVERGKFNSTGDEESVEQMDEACTDNPHSGLNCIKASFNASGSNWGGWYFMNGVLSGTMTSPDPNWGEIPDAGVDLTGATQLTFWAKGENGGERVEFFAFGVGRNPDTGEITEAYPGSSPKVSLGYVTLSNEWTEYLIPVSGKDVSYVLGGFGWVSESWENDHKDIIFFLDDIKYDLSRTHEPRFLVSYETIVGDNDFDIVLRNTAFTYDNALALIAFLASGEDERAGLVADALVYALHHDRFYDDGRIRNAYQGGDLILPPGWNPRGRENTVRIPGWYDPQIQSWLEDEYQVSTDTGNMAWAMLALLAYYEKTGGANYLEAAVEMGKWVEDNCRDSRVAGGYTAGYRGWEEYEEKLYYKSTEHNIDIISAYTRLNLHTGDHIWKERAEHAKQFVTAMWDSIEQKFWTGTLDDGVTINQDVVPLDVQAWALLSMKDEGPEMYGKALEYAETNLRVGDGFDFNGDLDGIWYEGTAQMAVAYRCTGQTEKWQEIVDFLIEEKDITGGFFASDKDNLTTGFNLSSGEPWLYFHRLHIGATAWAILAEIGEGTNPFWMGSKAKGDANGDGNIDALDITKVARIILEIDNITSGADSNRDGIINVLDMTAIARIILGLL